MIEFETIKEPVAAKQHQCSLCGRKIEKGEKYFYRTGKYDGYFFTEHLHFDCYAVISEYCSEIDSEYNQDDIAEWWKDAKCYNCKNYYPDPCDIWDRYCWCTQYEPVAERRNHEGTCC